MIKRSGAAHIILSQTDAGDPIDFMKMVAGNKEELYPYLRIADRYVIHQLGPQEFQVRLQDPSGMLLASGMATYASYQEATRALRRFWRLYDALVRSHCTDTFHEGFHLIEHILLRPVLKHPSSLMDVCIPDDCHFCGEEDPYSFRISVYFPFWPVRFRMTEARTYIENYIREQAPAHIQVRICWLENGQMYQLETAYKRWLRLRSQLAADPEAYSKALIMLLEVMNSLIDVHPEAFLHDCEEDADENPVKLDNTHLGTF